MKQIRRILILSFVFILSIAAIGCTGKNGIPDNTTGGAVGTDRNNPATGQYNTADQNYYDRYGNDHMTPYNTNYITNNMRATSGAIGAQNSGIGSAYTNR